jgi:hypothetical protein
MKMETKPTTQEVKEQIEVIQLPTRLMMDKLSILQGLVTLTKPQDTVFTDEQKWVSVWDEDEMLAIKEKILILIRDL